jgi:hypothetical protein
VLFVFALVALPGAASAQDVGAKGLTMGYPESIGVLWHVTDRVAIRPEFLFAHSTTDTNLPLDDDSRSSTSIGVGASALYYLSDRDNLRPYVAPRWMYGHSDPGSGGTSITTNTISGAFGAQYALSKRFSVFGESGLSYTHSTAKSDVLATITVKGNGIATHTAAGVILYF